MAVHVAHWWADTSWTNAPVSGIVDALAEAPDGTLWIGKVEETIYDTGAGLYRYDPANPKEQAKRIEALPAGNVNAVAVAPDGTVYAGINHRIHRSTDQGNTWTVIYDQPWTPHLLALGQDSTLYAGTQAACPPSIDWVPGMCTAPGGLFLQQPDETNWTPVDALNRATGSVTALAADEHRVYAGSPGGVFATADGGARWSYAVPYQKADATGRIVYDTFSDLLVTSAGSFFASSEVGNGLFRYAANDTAWVALESTQNGHLALVETASGTLLSGNIMQDGQGLGLYQSEDQGHTWARTAFADTSVSLLARDASTGTVYAVTEATPYRSYDDGATWTRLAVPAEVEVWQVEAAGGRIAMLIEDEAWHLLLSNDAGDSWRSVDVDFGVRDYLLTAEGLLVAIDDHSVRYLTADAATWHPIGSFEGSLARTLMLGPDEHLYVGTSSQGVLRSNLPAQAVTVEEAPRPHAVALGGNYPNPFHTATTIPLTLPRAEVVTLTMHDLLGRRLATLHNGPLPEGTHRIQWNARAFASGLYVCRLQTSTFTASRLVTLLR